jgi:hypothetical protein
LQQRTPTPTLARWSGPYKEDVSGLGHVKVANYERAKRRAVALLAELRNPAPVVATAE